MLFPIEVFELIRTTLPGNQLPVPIPELGPGESIAEAYAQQINAVYTTTWRRTAVLGDSYPYSLPRQGEYSFATTLPGGWVLAVENTADLELYNPDQAAKEGLFQDMFWDMTDLQMEAIVLLSNLTSSDIFEEYRVRLGVRDIPELAQQFLGRFRVTPERLLPAASLARRIIKEQGLAA